MTPKPTRNAPEFDAFPSYKGGHTTLYGTYVWELAPGHHLQNRWGWVAQHRLIGEDIVGRRLVQSKDPTKGEVVHHKDENRLNNDPSNLEVMTISDHRSHHTRKKNEERWAKLTEQHVIDALVGRTIKEAAFFLGVDKQTLRNRFQPILTPRQRKSPVRIHAPTTEEIAIVRRYAADPTLSVNDCKRDAHMSIATIGRLCTKLGIVWKKKSRKGELKRTYRGKPTPRALAIRAGQIEPENQTQS